MRRPAADLTQLAATLREHGHASMAVNHPVEAITSFTQALETVQRAGREHDTALILISLGEALAATGQEVRAVARLRQARTILSTGPDFYQQARAQAALGAALARYPQVATAHLEHALKIMRRLGALPEQAAILGTLGDVARDHGQPGEAIRRYRQALAILPGTHPAAGRLRSQIATLADDGRTGDRCEQPDPAVSRNSTGEDMRKETNAAVPGWDRA